MKKRRLLLLFVIVFAFTMLGTLPTFAASKTIGTPVVTSSDYYYDEGVIVWKQVKSASSYNVYSVTKTATWKYYKTVSKSKKAKYSDTSKYKLKKSKGKYKVYKKKTVNKYKKVKNTRAATYRFKYKTGKKYVFVIKAVKGKKTSAYSKKITMTAPYKVNFYSEGKLHYTSYAPKGSIPGIYDDEYHAPYKESEGNDFYFFTGWSPEVKKVTKNTRYDAVFEKVTYENATDTDIVSKITSVENGKLYFDSYLRNIKTGNSYAIQVRIVSKETGERLKDEKGNWYGNSFYISTQFGNEVKFSNAVTVPTELTKDMILETRLIDVNIDPEEILISTYSIPCVE